MKYFITYHAIERLKERFAVFYNKQPELKNWTKEKGTNCIKALFDKLVEQTDENRSYLNNSMYMLNLYEKYGYDTEYCFKELRSENILFVFTKSRSEKHYKLVTLMPTDYRPSVKNIKYNDKQKKKDKHDKFIMDWYESLDSKNKETVKQMDSFDIECSTDIKESLIKLVLENKTEIIARISNSKTHHKVILDNLEYEFVYSKTTGGKKEILLKKISELAYEIKSHQALQEYLSPELKRDLLVLVHNNQTDSEKISNSKSRHTAIWNGFQYAFIYQKTTAGDRNIILESEPCEINSIRKKCKM